MGIRVIVEVNDVQISKLDIKNDSSFSITGSYKNERNEKVTINGTLQESYHGLSPWLVIRKILNAMVKQGHLR